MTAQTILELSNQLRSGKITSQELVQGYLDRIKKYDSYYQAYEFVDWTGALNQARASDALRDDGVDLGILMGIPVAVKDLFHIDCMPTRVGSRLDVSSSFEPIEGEFISKLRAAGCIFLGKTKTAEFALSSSGINYKNGTPINPYSNDAPLVPGGSSSGSAVATAANLCAFAIGTDTGGSVRTPAAYCGLVGVKYGWDAMSSRGSFPLSETLDSYGIFTREVDCARRVTEALGLYTRQQTIPAALKIGILTYFKKQQLDSDVERCWTEALQKLTDAGHSLAEISIDGWHPELDKTYSAISRAEAYTTVNPCLSAENEDLVNPEILRKIKSGASIETSLYISSLRRRQSLIQMADKLFDQFDILMTPTKPTTPPTYPLSYAGPEADDRVLSKTGVFTREINMLQMSGINVPIHQLGSEFPVGLQLIGRANDVNKLLKCALTVEKIVGVSKPNKRIMP